MNEVKLGIFGGEDRPDSESAWKLREQGKGFNEQIRLDDTVRVNENFYVGKQWEGVESNGLPTPQLNFLKRVVGFTTATVCTDNMSITASPMDAAENVDELVEPVRIVNDEFSALTERVSVPAKIRVFARNAAVDGDGVTFTYWDPEIPAQRGRRGAIQTEVLDNTNVYFGNPNSREVQSQPWIIVESREPVRSVKLRARKNKISGWEEISSDSESDHKMESAKATDNMCTVILTLWKDDDGEIWAYESCRQCSIREPWSLGIRLYPITWMPWDLVKDCYHGQAMITGLVPNQIAVNKMLAMQVIHQTRMAFPKYLYNSTLIRKWDNRVGGSIGVPGGDLSNAVRVVEGVPASPQVSQSITQLVKDTEESMGATGTAMGEGRADNTSAIIALQRAAATPTELTKQNLYQTVEDLYRIYLEFMATYYGKRMVEMEPPQKILEAAQFAGMNPPEKISMEFDFSMLREHPMTIKLDVGASSYYSEMASMKTLDNLLQLDKIDLEDYLERVPDSYIPGRRKLIAKYKRLRSMQEAGGMPGMSGMPGDPAGGMPGSVMPQEAPMPQGGGYSTLQRKINETGQTSGLF